MRLESVATISVGQILTRVLDWKSETKVKVLQPKAIGNGVIDDDCIEEIPVSKEIDQDKLTRVGDVVIKLSTPYEAVVIDEQHNNLVIPSFCAVLRTNAALNSYYICALLNSTYIKEQIKAKIAGTIRPMVKINDLRNVEIPDVSKDKMESIGKEYELSLKKLDLLSRIINTEKEIMENRLLEIVLEGSKYE